MKELYFVSPYSRSMRTIHFQYGYAGKNDKEPDANSNKS